MAASNSAFVPTTAAVVVIVAGWILIGPRGKEENAPSDAAADSALSPEALARDPAPGPSGNGLPVRAAAQVCGDVGYLCAGLRDSASIRLYHWPAETAVLDVLVPPPPHEPPDRAAEFQRAARRGIERWDGIPIPVRIRLRDTGDRPPDVVLRWVDRLPGEQLGATRWSWRGGPGGTRVTISDFVLATRAPTPGTPALSARDIELTAAHEMGHVLGLPHSDSERDVMYPKSTATSVTPRDFRTARALYLLPPGVTIQR